MRARLAKKVKDHPERYTIGKFHAALIRLGYIRQTWRLEIDGKQLAMITVTNLKARRL